MAILFMSSALRERENGLPVEIIVPEEWTGQEISGISLVANSPNPEEAKTFIDWAPGAEAMDLGTAAGSWQIKADANAAPSPDGPRLEGIKVIDYDFEMFGDPELQGRLIARWTDEILPVPR